MSVFLDSGSGKWFNTLEELKAFQKRGASGSSISIKTQQEVGPKKEEATEPIIEKDPEIEAKEEKPDIEYSIETGVIINLTPEEMKEELRNSGMDARAYSRKSDEDLAEFYYKFKNRK